MTVHIHFGTGDFGLGFAGYISKILGNELILANRTMSEFNQRILNQKKYNILYSNNEFDEIDIADVIISDPQDDKLIAIISNADILTTSIKNYSGLDQIIDAINKAVDIRSSNRKLVVCAFENGFDTHQIRARVSDRARQICLFPRSVVDRICNRRQVVDGTPCVRAEKFAMLFIENELGELKKRLSTARDRIKIVDDINNAKRMKLWIMNSTHMAISINAHYHDKIFINEFCRENEDYVRLQLSEFVKAYHYWLDINELDLNNRVLYSSIADNYAENLYDRLCQNIDMASRVIGDAISDTKYTSKEGKIYFELRPLFEKIAERLVAPFDMIYERECDVPRMTSISLSRLNYILYSQSIKTKINS